MSRKAIWVGILSVAVVALGTAWVLATQQASLHGAVIDPPLKAAAFQLQDDTGQTFTLSSQQGKVVVLYFGYTNCPDECPLTMAHLKLAMDQLGDQAKDVQVAMVTTDPARDNAQVLKSFMDKFDPSFVGLLGATDQLAKVWHDYGVTVADGGETHSKFIYVIDREGNFRETFLPDSEPADIAADIRLLLRAK